MKLTPPDLSPPGDVDFLVLFGSHSHGTSTAMSDEDWRGVFRAPADSFLGLDRVSQTWQQKPDVVAWELGHFCHLLLKGNPNIVGMLSTPDDCVYAETRPITLLRERRERFITRAMAQAYLGWIETELRHADLTPKRLSHIPRLYWELETAMLDGVVQPRLEGSRRDFVMDVKMGRATRGEVEDLVRPELDGLWARVPGLPDPPRAWVQEILLAARHGEL